jgi:hypothetical protein
MEDIEKPNVNFDILNWWKVNSSKFPVLAKIARYSLALEGVCWIIFEVHWPPKQLKHWYVHKIG